MKLEGRWRFLPLTLIAVVGLSGVIEALPHASESVNDLLIDAAILAIFVALSVLAARAVRNRKTTR